MEISELNQIHSTWRNGSRHISVHDNPPNAALDRTPRVALVPYLASTPVALRPGPEADDKTPSVPASQPAAVLCSPTFAFRPAQLSPQLAQAARTVRTSSTTSSSLAPSKAAAAAAANHQGPTYHCSLPAAANMQAPQGSAHHGLSAQQQHDQGIGPGPPKEQEGNSIAHKSSAPSCSGSLPKPAKLPAAAAAAAAAAAGIASNSDSNLSTNELLVAPGERSAGAAAGTQTATLPSCSTQDRDQEGFRSSVRSGTPNTSSGPSSAEDPAAKECRAPSSHGSGDGSNCSAGRPPSSSADPVSQLHHPDNNNTGGSATASAERPERQAGDPAAASPPAAAAQSQHTKRRLSRGAGQPQPHPPACSSHAAAPAQGEWPDNNVPPAKRLHAAAKSPAHCTHSNNFGADGGGGGSSYPPGANRSPGEDVSPAHFDDMDGDSHAVEPEPGEDCRSNSSSQPHATKRTRLVWTPELHHRFMAAVHQLGVNSAVPKSIMQVMNVEGMTRENVASHLQKYRLYLKRLAGITGNKPIPTHVLQQVQDEAVRQHHLNQMAVQHQQQQQHQQASQQQGAAPAPAPAAAAQAQQQAQAQAQAQLGGQIPFGAGFGYVMPGYPLMPPTARTSNGGVAMPCEAQGLAPGAPGTSLGPLQQAQQQQQAAAMQQALLQQQAGMGGGGTLEQQAAQQQQAAFMMHQATAQLNFMAQQQQQQQLLQQAVAAAQAQVQGQAMAGMVPYGMQYGQPNAAQQQQQQQQQQHYMLVAAQQQQQAAAATGGVPAASAAGGPAGACYTMADAVQQQQQQQQQAAAMQQALLQQQMGSGTLEQQQQQQSLIQEVMRQQQMAMQQEHAAAQASHVRAYMQMQAQQQMQMQHMYAQQLMMKSQQQQQQQQQQS